MSLSKVAQNCDFCKTDSGIYSCPRCNRRYCSTRCYKSQEHEVCSESFYREWVETSLRNKAFAEDQKTKMVNILKKCHDEFADDDDDNNSEEPSIADRFAGLNIDDADDDVLWQNLSNEEKAQFKALIEDESHLEDFVQLKQPWWTVTMLNLVSDMDKEQVDKDDISTRPHFPLNVKKLSDLTSKKPSSCLQFNMVNILYGYAFLYRFFNCDLKDFLEDVAGYLFILCPVLSDGRNYYSLEESVQDSIRLIMSLNLNVSMEFAKSIVNDVHSLLQGPSNAKPTTFVLCALHDIEILLLETKTLFEGRKDVPKDSRRRIMPAVKKIEYFMSWGLDFESNFSELASELLLLMLPELLTEPENSTPEEITKEVVKKKPLIEEVN